MSATEDAAANRVIHRDIVCPFCGCTCDDLDVAVEGDRVVEVERACDLGRGRFLAPRAAEEPICLIGAKPCAWEDGVRAAAEILTGARTPLIVGVEHLTCEAQSLAVSLADAIGAMIDTTANSSATYRGTPLQQVGESTCTLGELAHRADLVVFWNCDPETTHPRFVERYLPDRPTELLPGGRRDRTIIAVVETADEESPAADVRLSVPVDLSFEVIVALRGLVNGVKLDEHSLASVTGVSHSALNGLVDRLKRCAYGVLIFSTDDPHLQAALHALVIELNEHTRFASLRLSSVGNLVGAENVLAWRTGYPCSVNFAAGYPRFAPAESTPLRQLAHGECDAVVLLGLANSSGPIQKNLRALSGLPCVVIASEAATTALQAAVSIRTATPGVEAEGTWFRMDGIPLPLRAVVSSPLPTTETVLRRLLQQLEPY